MVALNGKISPFYVKYLEVEGTEAIFLSDEPRLKDS